MGPGLRKLKKKKKQPNQPFFEGQKSLDMGRGFRPRVDSLQKKKKKKKMSTPGGFVGRLGGVRFKKSTFGVPPPPPKNDPGFGPAQMLLKHNVW